MVPIAPTRTPTWTTTDSTSATTDTFVIQVRDESRLWFEPRSAEEQRREERRRELERFLALVAERRERRVRLARALTLSERRPRPKTAREPAQRPKARSTSGAERWRVRNPNA